MFSKYYANKDIVGMHHIYKLVTRWILTLVIPVLILIILFSTKIMLLFGADFLQSSKALITLSIGTSIFAILGVSSTVLVVSGYQKLNLINALCATILNICLNIILIPKYGIIGAAWATLSSMTFIALARLIETWIFLKINPYSIKIFKSIVAGIITYGILQYIKPYLMLHHTIITLRLESLYLWL